MKTEEKKRTLLEVCNALRQNSEATEEVRNRESALRREETSLRNERLAQVKELAFELRKALNAQDWDELCKHLPELEASQKRKRAMCGEAA